MYEYKDRLKLLGLDSLEKRRLKFDLIMYYKILHGYVNVDYRSFFTLNQNVKNTRTNGLMLCKPLTKSKHPSNTFSIRCINCWNSLPIEIVKANNINVFKNGLNKFDFSNFLLP